MKKIKLFKVMAVIAMCLGFIHITVTPLIVFSMKGLGHKSQLVFTYMFTFTGVGILFIGWVQYYILRKWNNDEKLLTILKVSVFVVIISGIGAVATMWNNPFAYIILFLALYEIILLKNLATNSTN